MAYRYQLTGYVSRDTFQLVEAQEQDNSAFVREAVRRELDRRGDLEDENNE